jgi:S1-C subfamily serine protease
LTGVAGIALKGMIQARDSRNDLALILVDRRLDSIAAFRARPARSGEDVIALGFPLSGLLAQDLNVSTGIVSATAGLLNDTSRLQISAAVQPGNSGGPLLDSAGAVVGVVVSKLNALAVARAIGDIPQNINFAIKAPIAEVFLRSQRVEPRIAGTTAVVVVAVADVVDAARAYTFLVECDPELLCLFGASL